MMAKFIFFLFLLGITPLVFSEPTYPYKVDLSILSAVIGPSKFNSKPWDSSLTQLGKVAGSIPSVLTPDPSIIFIKEVLKNAPSGTAAPDVIGTLVLSGSTTEEVNMVFKRPLWLSHPKTVTKDSYTPSFFTELIALPLFENTRIRIELWDKDLSQNDLIGKVELNIDDVKLAIQKKKPVYIKVADQSFNQILYIQISARESLKNSKFSFSESK